MKRLFCIVTLFIVTIGAHARQSDMTTAVDSIFSPMSVHFPGMSIVVAHPSGIVFSHALGHASIESDVPYEADTRSRVYSVSKPWTAAAALTLVERGLLAPGTPVGQILPDLPEALQSATIFQLATHTSGIRHYADEAEANSARRCESPEQALNLFVNDPLLFQPGEGRQYSSWAFVLLSAALSRVAETPFHSLMRSAVFEPLGMEHVHAAWSDDPAERAIAYTRAPDGSFVDAESNVSCKFGAGGFHASAEDLARFYAGLMNGQILSEQSRAMLLQPDENGLIFQQGVGEGGRSQVVVDVPRRVAIAFTANAAGNDVTFDAVSEAMIETAIRVGGYVRE